MIVRMVLSIFDLKDYAQLLDIQPLKKINRSDGYDYYLYGHRLGIGTTDPIAECDVRGTVRCVEMLMVSDRSQKQNVVPLDLSTCASIVEKLSVYSYEFKAKPGTTKWGFIAQDVELLVPTAVVLGADGIKTIDVVQLLAVVVGAVKTLAARVDQLARGSAAI
jgi:hypothetical protein